MLRLVLLVFYLFAASSTSQEKQGGSLDPLGLTTPPPTSDAGAGYDPNGVSSPPQPPPADAGAGFDPNG